MRLVRCAGVVLLLLGLLAGSSFAAGDTAPVQKEVKDWLDAYAKAYEKKDINSIMAMVSPDSSTVFVDNGPQGRHVGEEAIKAAYQAEFKQIKSAVLEYTWLSAASKGDIAWFATELTAKVDLGKQKIEVPGRWTGVLEKRGGKWLMVLSHFSYTASDDEKDEK
ncbi:MAG TPA: nuclear transport factor 2 family protein [Desulfomonilaceae bacterium]|nr:nuclear transport factor 2 family protein [Desulfomonilaceae bacterium]